MKSFIFLTFLLAWLTAFQGFGQGREGDESSVRALQEQIKYLERQQKTYNDFTQMQINQMILQDSLRQKNTVKAMESTVGQLLKEYRKDMEQIASQKTSSKKEEIALALAKEKEKYENQIKKNEDMALYVGFGLVILNLIGFGWLYITLQRRQITNNVRNAANLSHEVQEVVEDLLKEYFPKHISKESESSITNILRQQNEHLIEKIALIEQKIEVLALISENATKAPESEPKTTPQTQEKTVQSTTEINNKEENTPSLAETVQAIEKEMQVLAQKEQKTQEKIQEVEKPFVNIEQIQPKTLEEAFNEIKNSEEEEIIVYSKEQEQEEEKVLETQESFFDSLDTENTQDTHQDISTSDSLLDETEIVAETTNITAKLGSLNSLEVNQLLQKAIEAYEKRDFTEAIRHYTDLVEHQPDYLYYTRRANCYHILKKYDLAAEDYQKALRLEPTFIPAYNNAIEIYILTENYFQSLTMLEQLSKIDKNVSSKAVELYLKLITEKALSQNTEKTEKEIDVILKENFTFSFSVKELEDWLFGADIDAVHKKIIRLKTELLKMKREYAMVS